MRPFHDDHDVNDPKSITAIWHTAKLILLMVPIMAIDLLNKYRKRWRWWPILEAADSLILWIRLVAIGIILLDLAVGVLFL